MNKYNLLDILTRELELKEHDASLKYKFDGIQIPMIQRDYAQGRIEEVEIRNRFLTSIFEALQKNDHLELDFVYGSIKMVDKKCYFLPLDGQQRLTTLFLLLFYIGNRELSTDSQEDVQKALKKFTYATRTSARDFCEKLATLPFNFSTHPSKLIQQFSWFHKRFEKDPTVRSMLNMLDAIHVKYEDHLSKYPDQKLFNNISKLSFYVLPLDGFNLTDELYIKMNARGKQLTDYENFKADLINWLKKEDNIYQNEFHKLITYNTREMSYHLSFSIKLDNDWSNIFWQNATSEKKLVDPFFLRFWNRYLLNLYISESTLSQDNIEKTETFQKLYKMDGYESSFKYEGFKFYQNLFEISGAITNAQIVLDGFTSNYSDIMNNLKPSWDLRENWNLFDERINQRQRVIFLAVTLYLQKNKYDSERFKQWLKVVWNIVVDPDNRSIPVMIAIMKLVYKLSDNSGNIYTYLTSDSFETFLQNETSSFIKTQLEEERLKAELISSEAEWEDDIIEYEKHPLFQGNIKFLLLNSKNRIQIRHRYSIANLIFDGKGTSGKFCSSHLLLRAVIAKINTWDELQDFNMTDSLDNWQLLLRRNVFIQNLISNWCDSKNAEVLITELEEVIKANSTMDHLVSAESSEGISAHVHNQLYHDNIFHQWMQDNGAIKLKWSNNFLYIHRPRSWYDWVALNTYRNEIAASLCKKHELSSNNRCGDSNFFWGSKIELYKVFSNYTLTCEFNEINNLKIGVKIGNSLDSNTITPNQIVVPENEWLLCVNYDYGVANTPIAIEALIKKIDFEVFEASNKISLINCIS